jgi:DNA-binding XRE family transcriptional regulator
MKLETYRKNKKLNYDQLSEYLGISRATTYNICKENIKCVTLRNAHIIVSKTFGIVDYPELLWGDC